MGAGEVGVGKMDGKGVAVSPRNICAALALNGADDPQRKISA
jgi:hypothetical protein